MGLLRTAALLAATVATGLFAGLFYAFACSVMPGLRAADDRTFVVTLQRINVAILNGWFFATFLGAPVLILIAGALHLPPGVRAPLPWIVAALVLDLVALAVTGRLNIPLNNALAAAGDGDPAAARAAFEALWVRWNVVRAVAGAAAFACLAVALTRGT